MLETQLKQDSLQESLERTQKYDAQFGEFLGNYRTQHKDIANIVDMSHYARSKDPFSKDQKARQEEIQMLNEFRRRQTARK